VEDFDGTYPICDDETDDDQDFWFHKINPYGPNARPSNLHLVKVGGWVCPSAPPMDLPTIYGKPAIGRTEMFFGYNRKSLGNDPDDGYIRQCQLKHLDEFIVIGDSTRPNESAPFNPGATKGGWRVNPIDYNIPLGITRHNGANVLSADGHVEKVGDYAALKFQGSVVATREGWWGNTWQYYNYPIN
jgi:prepilin-type processing-associated H-X9-DG protein